MKDSFTLSSGRGLRGEPRVPGDKSISHRALMLAALADGTTEIWGLSVGEDVRSTRRCLEALGAKIEDAGEKRSFFGREHWTQVKVHGRGPEGFKRPAGSLDCGNSGTTMRLLMGLAAGLPFPCGFDGDASLRRRPMRRVAEPLTAMGAQVELAGGDFAPLTVHGAALCGIDFRSPVASAQVKSAVLLAGLQARGRTKVTEPALSRDHTETLLGHFGAKIRREEFAVSLEGPSRLKAKPLAVPGDPSSAAFWLAAACIVPGSSVRVRGVCVNPTRMGFAEILKRMGARLSARAERPGPGAEPVADLSAEPSTLEAAVVSPEEFPALIDEAPLLAVVATQASGETRIRGVGELRHKETDRVEGIAALLRSFGAEAAVEDEDLVVRGPQKLAGGVVEPRGDHRLAMAGAVAALAASGPTEIRDAGCADISYPGFFAQLRELQG